MERYELDKEYEFEFVGKDTRTYYDGTHYFYVKDDEKQYRVKAYDYQWDYDAIPSVLLCKVKHLNPICIEQSKSFILRDRYPFPKESVFEIREIRHDNKTQALYYVLKDAYGIYHRYYPKADEPYKPGDNIKLWVNGIKQDTGGAVHLELSSIGNIDNRRDISFREYSKWLEPSNESGYPPILICREGEGQYVEFKSCLSIPAGSLEPDIDKQSEIIVKVIAGFLNADGGTLYIGLDDNGYLREGIAADYPYLSKSNKLHYSYKENDDSYIRFITDRVRNWLGTTAQSYVHAQINCEKGRKYCIIKVDRSPIPIWFMHRALYERMGQNISHHVDNDITFYILKRFGYIDVLANLAKISRVEDPSMPQSHESSVEDEISPSSEVESKDIETITAIDATFGLFDKEKSVSYGSIYFLSGGRFVVSDKKSPIKDFIYKAELPQKARQMRSHDFVICYDNGDTDIVDLSQAIFNKSGDIIDTRVYEKGWNSSKVIKAAFSVLNNNQNRDIVAYVYRNNGVVYLKCCELSCLAKNPHKQFGNSGNQVLPNDSTLIYSMRIPGSSSVKHLLNTKALLFDSPADRNKFGIQISDIEGRFKLSLSKVLEAVVDDITLSTMPQPSITEADNSGEPTKSETLPSKAEDMPVVEDGKSNDSELNSEQGIQDFGRYNELYVIANGFELKLPDFKFKVLRRQLENLPITYDSIMSLLKDSYPELDDIGNKYIICSNSERQPYYGQEFVLKVYRYIIDKQSTFLTHPLTLDPVCIKKTSAAKELNIDVSSFSRITSKISLICKSGIFSAKDIFSQSELRDRSGNNIHPKQLERVLSELRADSPDMTDEELTECVRKLLNANIARRTVAKYRKKSKITNSRGKI